MSELTKQLQQARKAQKLSQRKLGSMLDIPQSYLSNIESGKVDIRLSSLVELARALGHEVMLVPKLYVPAVKAIIKGESKSTPMWQLKQDHEDE